MLHRIIRTIKAFALSLLLLSAIPFCIGRADDATAENLSAKCKYSADFTLHAERLRDNDYDTVQRINKGKTVSVEWDDSIPVASVCISLDRLRAACPVGCAVDYLDYFA